MNSEAEEPAIISHVAVVADRIVYLEFADGARGHVDLRPWLEGPVFESLLRDPEEFGQVGLDGLGSISWPNGADLDADVLRLSLEPIQSRQSDFGQRYAIISGQMTKVVHLRVPPTPNPAFSVIDVDSALPVGYLGVFAQRVAIPDDLSDLIEAQ